MLDLCANAILSFCIRLNSNLGLYVEIIFAFNLWIAFIFFFEFDCSPIRANPFSDFAFHYAYTRPVLVYICCTRIISVGYSTESRTFYFYTFSTVYTVHRPYTIHCIIYSDCFTVCIMGMTEREFLYSGSII